MEDNTVMQARDGANAAACAAPITCDGLGSVREEGLPRAEAARLASLSSYAFDDLVSLMSVLRGPGGCPWDKEQTHATLKRYLIEEAYETLEAIDNADDAALCEELGDVLLQVAFHANVSDAFDIGDVITRVCRKMVLRHPHIFADAKASDSSEVLKNWERIKQAEKGQRDHASRLKGVPRNLPALMRAYKVQQKAADAGFDWDDTPPVLDKVREELGEAAEALGMELPGDGAVARGSNLIAKADGPVQSEIDEEIGDLLFAAVNLSRFAGAHPELALASSTDKFIARFERMEAMIAADGRSLDGMGLSEMDVFWERAKKALREEGAPG